MTPTWMAPEIFLGIVLAIFLTYAVVGPVAANLGRFIGKHKLLCPTHNAFGVMKFNAFGAALGSGYGPPKPHIRQCSLRHPGENCDEGCLKDTEF